MPQETVGYVELEWTCVHCGTKNPGTAQTCTGCGAPMGDSEKFNLPSQQKLITDKDALVEGASRSRYSLPLVRHTQCGRRYQVRPLRRRPDGRRGRAPKA